MSRDGDLTPQARILVDEFVDQMFVRKLAEYEGITAGEARKRVLWFKNWVGLQSVRGVDHLHVIVRDAPGEVVRGWYERKDL